jgi:excinuclease ABC subunit C
MTENNFLKEKVELAPRCPGVYLMKDAAGKIIYVGKANDLKNRISQYFTGKDTRPMAPFLLSRISDIEFITTATEKEALILENNLIKQHRPRYNVIMRDDKTYYHLGLDPNEFYPRLQLVRQIKNKKARYFGPYPSGLSAKETLRFVLSVFPLRTCRDRDFKLRRRPCLEYQIGRCLAPCAQLIDEISYKKLIEGVLAFLGGHSQTLISELKAQMADAAENLDYEEAAVLRNRIAALDHVLEKQNVDWAAGRNQDVFGVYETEGHFQLCVLFIRDGKLLGKKSFAPVKSHVDMAEVVSAGIQQYYDSGTDIPPEIIVPVSLPDSAVIEEWLTDKKERKVTLTLPLKGDKKNLLELAVSNARSVWEQEHRKEEQKISAMKILQEKLSLKNPPRRIECYDISNISGSHAVGSMVVLQDGEPDKDSYRRFRIKTVQGADDYAMMQEVLSRRFAHAENLPDLIVVDGGKGQLNVALAVLKELQISIDVIGLAKEERSPSLRNFPSTRGRGLRGRGVKNLSPSPCPSPPASAGQAVKGEGKEGSLIGSSDIQDSGQLRTQKNTTKSEDRVFLPKRKDAIFLSKWPHALAVLQRVRDEAHRFAVSYHHKLKEQDDLSSVLDNIPDIGDERKTALLKYFETVSRIKEATIEKLQEAPGIGKGLAGKIHEYFLKGA